MSLRPGAAPVEEIPAGLLGPHPGPRVRRALLRRARGDPGVFQLGGPAAVALPVGRRNPSPSRRASAARRAHRYADPVITPDGRWVICVHEHHRPDGRGRQRPGRRAPRSPRPGRVRPGPGVRPRLLLLPAAGARTGSRLAWLSWDHPAHALGPDPAVGRRTSTAARPRRAAPGCRRPWRVHHPAPLVARRGAALRLGPHAAGGISTTRPAPASVPSGRRVRAAGLGVRAATYGFLPDDRLVAVWTEEGEDHLGYVAGGRAEPQDLPFSSYAELQPAPGGVVALAASPTQPLAVVRLDLAGRDGGAAPQPGGAARPGGHLHARTPWRSPPGPARSPTPSSTRPGNPAFAGPDGERPPVVVMIHGGPTAEHRGGVQPPGAVLDDPGVRGGRRRLPGQHRVRHRLPAAPQRRVGRRRRRGLRQRGALAGGPGPRRRRAGP